MRIVHIVHGRVNPKGHNGISIVVYNLNKYEKLKGINSEIWGLIDGVKSHYTYKRDEYVTIECFPRVRNPFDTHEIIERLREEKDSIDLVHFHMIWFYDKNIIAKALKEIGIEFIITTHGTYVKPHAYTGKRMVAKLVYELEYLNMAKEIHIITREEGSGLHRYGYEGRTFVAYNGIDLDTIPKYRKRDFFDDKPYRDKIKFLWLGVLRDDKNIKSLIKAVSYLPDNIREKIVFILVGPNYKNNWNRYKKLAKELNCKDNFDYIGPLYGDDKYNAMESANLYVMPSFSEVFSIATLEAMACAKPCLITSGCGFNYVSEEKFYIKCEPYPDDIKRGLLEILSLEEQWDSIGQMAQDMIKSRLNWDSISDVMIENYQRLVKDIQCGE